MSYPHGMQPPPARRPKQPLWLWLVIGLAGVSIVAMIAVLFIDFGSGDDADADLANAESNAESTSVVNAGNRLYMQIVEAGKGRRNPYELVATIPPDANREQIVSIAMVPGSKEFLLGSLPRNAGPNTEPTFVYWDVTKRAPVRRLDAAMLPGMRLHGISPGGELALFLDKDSAYYVGLEEGGRRTFRRFRNNPAGPRGDIYLHPDGKSYVTFYVNDLIVAPLETAGEVSLRVDLPESDQYVRIHPLFARNEVMYFTGTPGAYSLRMISLLNGAVGRKHSVSQMVTDLSSLHTLPHNNGVFVETAEQTFIVTAPRGGTGYTDFAPEESPAFFLPRTQILVLTGAGTIRLWDMATNVDLANFTAHPETVTRDGKPTVSAKAIGTPDGQTLITVGENGSLKFWELRK